MNEIAQTLTLLNEHRVDCVIVGGVAGSAHGSTQATFDVDVCYSRERSNLIRLVQALRSVNATLRGAPKDIPFILDEETLRRGLNFTFPTEFGDLDLLGEVSGVGSYDDCLTNSTKIEVFGHVFSVLSLKKLIDAKRASGRSKDIIALPELEALFELEAQTSSSNAEPDA